MRTNIILTENNGKRIINEQYILEHQANKSENRIVDACFNCFSQHHPSKNDLTILLML